ncbi:MAG: hypothetical protein PVF58_02080 [Candidatus Methanofastidiosia archaeon]|jgi:hypothetical protein
MDKKVIIIVFLLVFFQVPSLTVDIILDTSLYQPGEHMKIEITVENKSGTKECLKFLEIKVSDPYAVFWGNTDTYPADTECVDAGNTNVYTFWCDIPVTVSEGKGTVDVTVQTWSDITLQETEFFGIGVNYPPEVTILEYSSQVNPAQEYELSFSVFDNFGVEDITYVEVLLYSAEGNRKVSPRSGYEFTWEKPDNYTVWEGNPGPVQVVTSLQPQEIVWTVTFQVDEIAQPGEWILEITAYDVHHKSHSMSQPISITRYLSFHIEGESKGMASINFGKASPGEGLRRVPLTVVVTSNAEVMVSVEAHDLYSSEGSILPADNFYVKTQSGDVQLQKRQQVLYAGFGTKGYNQNAHIVLIFYGQLPEVLEAGTYSGVWYIVVEVV